MSRAELFFKGYPHPVLERFRAFHKANPQVYAQFKRNALLMKARRPRYSARTIMEVIRWNTDLRTSGDVFDINNDFIPIYVRLLIYHRPEFEGFFELRRVRSRGIGSEEEREREGELLL